MSSGRWAQHDGEFGMFAYTFLWNAMIGGMATALTFYVAVLVVFS